MSTANKVQVRIRKSAVSHSAGSYMESINQAIRLTEDKKIDRKNAFDYNHVKKDDIKQFMEAGNIENKWIRSAEALGAGAKIYGFRVDNVHMDAYKMLGNLSRNAEMALDVVPEQGENGEFSDDENDGSGDKKREKKAKQKRAIKLTGKEGESTLEVTKNVDLKKYERDQTAADPIFKQITKKFDSLS